MAKFEGMPRAYTRPEGEEEVTPPLDEPRFSAAAALLVQANRGGAPTPPLTLSESPESPSARAAAVDALLGRVEPAGPAPPDPDSPESPSAAAAAVLCGQLTQVHHTNSSDSLMGDDRAVNCLLALATDPDELPVAAPAALAAIGAAWVLAFTFKHHLREFGEAARRRVRVRPAHAVQAAGEVILGGAG